MLDGNQQCVTAVQIFPEFTRKYGILFLEYFFYFLFLDIILARSSEPDMGSTVLAIFFSLSLRRQRDIHLTPH